MDRFEAHHGEVLAALGALGNPRRGEAVRRDRGSTLTHLGIGMPALRARVKSGFSFTSASDAAVLQAWDALWQRSPCADVLFAALMHYEPIVRKRVTPELWPVMRAWIGRVDNWCHADMLAGLYSRLLAADMAQVYPQLQDWNESTDIWQRRLSLTSLVHYTGRNAVFLRAEQMLPLLAGCVADHRQQVASALGWVLREAARAYPDEVRSFIDAHGPAMSPKALARARAAQSSSGKPT